MRNVPKVLHAYKVFRPDVDGGVPSAIATLCASTSQNFNSSVLVARSQGPGRCYRADGTLVEAVTSFGTLFSTPVSPAYPFAFLKRGNSSDVVIHHAPFPLTDIVAPRLAKHVSLIVYWHADITTYPLLKKIMQPAILRTLDRADKIIVSDSSMIAASDTLTPFAAKCSAVPYGANLRFWSSCTQDEEKSAALIRQRHPRMILAIGRLVPYKGFSSLLQALESIEGEAVIIGEGPLLQDLKKEALELGVSDRVIFKGRLEPSEIKAYFHAARVLAFPSITAAEAFGLVQLEAMASGLPIVNTALPTAVPKIARHDREALTVAPNDPYSLSLALKGVLDDSSLAKRLAQAGKARALSEYSQATYVSRVEGIYQELIEQQRRRSTSTAVSDLNRT
jgi:glycosyltransferase involved in cell wall biosynthesis